MMAGRPAKVTISGLTSRGSSWRVRWRVGTKQYQRTFRSKTVADRFRRSLFDAVDGGAGFDMETGDPLAWGPREVPTVAAWARQWWVARWDENSARTRASDAEMLVDLATGTLVREVPDDVEARKWVRQVICRRPGTDSPEITHPRILRGGTHIERWSPTLDAIDHAAAKKIWGRLGQRLDGKTAAASTTNRRRTLATKVFDDAVRAGYLQTNPLRAIDRPRRRSAAGVDPTQLPRPTEARQLIDAVSVQSKLGVRAATYLRTLLLAGSRPAEAMGLKTTDITRPRQPGEWGVLTFRRGLTQANAAYTDDGESWDERDVLKWRAEGETRRVAVPPELLDAIDSHIAEFGTAGDGRNFVSATGAPIASDLSVTWRAAVNLLWPEGHPFHHLRPYDLRHIHATALLMEGVSPMRVAERLGHSVEVLFRTYAGVFAETDEIERARIGAALV